MAILYHYTETKGLVGILGTHAVHERDMEFACAVLWFDASDND